MRVLRSFVIGAVAILTAAALVQPAAATTFDWTQNGGFLLGTGTLRAGQFFGADAAAVAGNGGLDFFGLQPSPAPAGTYKVIGWGCPADGNNDGVATGPCANAGVAAEATTGTDPSTIGAGRSALQLDVFDSSVSGVLDSVTSAFVVIAKITHFNEVIDNESNALKAITVSANLVIDTSPTDTEDLNDVPIGFLETNNAVTPCGGVNPLGSTCDDVFTFDASEFVDVPFSSGGEDFFLQFTIAPPDDCDTVDSVVGTITIFQCDDAIAHKIAIDFANGLAWAAEGFDSSFLVLMQVTEERVGIPAPAGLALIGLGLAGLGLRAWRKRKTAA